MYRKEILIMKKLCALISALVLAAFFTACSGTDSNQTDPVQNSDTAVSAKIVRGEYDREGLTYKNPVTGLDFTVPVGWYALSDREVAEQLLSGVSYEEFSSWSEEDYAKQPLVPDTAVIDSKTGANIIIMYENLALNDASDISEEAYFNLASSSLPREYNYTISDREKVTIDGAEYTVYFCTGTTQGQSFTQVFLLRTLGDYIMCGLYTTFGDVTVDQVTALFR